MNLIPFITGVTVPKLNQERMRAIEIPLAPLQVQVELANEIEKERMQVDGAISLIEKYERKIQGVLAKLWLVN
jgi:type I restriction enzyme S subunit